MARHIVVFRFLEKVLKGFNTERGTAESDRAWPVP